MAGFDDIVRLVAAGETETVEFKATTGQRTEAARTLSAMLNAHGGVVVFGVGPKGSVSGQQVSDKTLEDITNACGEIHPSFPPSIERIPVPGSAGNELLVARVPAGTAKPYSYRGRHFIRSGAATVDMPDETQLALVLERAHLVDRWELAESKRTIGDLDSGEIRGLRDDAIANQRGPFRPHADVGEVLAALQLLDGRGEPNRAAVMLFGAKDRLGPEYAGYGCHLVAVAGTTLGVRFTDEVLVEDNVFASLRAATGFCERHLNHPVRIEGIQADAGLEIPLPVIREAIANALAHRDYSAPGHVQVRVFVDRVEVLSPGSLHFGLTPADLYETHISRPWNPLILGAMYRRGIVDQLGSGTLRITQSCADAGLGRPIFAASTSAVTCTIPRRGYWITPNGTSVSVPDVDAEALRLLADGPIQRGDLVARLGLSERESRDVLDRLREYGQAHLVGHGRGARWVLGPADTPPLIGPQ